MASCFPKIVFCIISCKCVWRSSTSMEIECSVRGMGCPHCTMCAPFWKLLAWKKVHKKSHEHATPCVSVVCFVCSLHRVTHQETSNFARSPENLVFLVENDEGFSWFFLQPSVLDSLTIDLSLSSSRFSGIPIEPPWKLITKTVSFHPMPQCPNAQVVLRSKIYLLLDDSSWALFW